MNDAGERPNRLPWPPIIAGSAIVAALVLGRVLPFPLGWLAWPLRVGLGVTLIAIALALDIWAMKTLAAGKTTIMPHRRSSRLVTGGPFRFSRNPIYLANMLLIPGLGLITANGWFLATAFMAAIATQRLAIMREERHLAALFGDDFARYRMVTRRWL